MQLREATLADVDTLVAFKLEIVRTWFDDPAYVDDAPAYPARLRDRLVDLLPRDHHRFVVAEVDDAIVGCISASVLKHLPGPDWSGVHGHVADLYVLPAHRGRGLARALMEDSMAWLRRQEAFMADMDATKGAVAMYVKMGWVPRHPHELDQQFTTLEYHFDAEH